MLTKEILLSMGYTEEQAQQLLEAQGVVIPKTRFDEVNNAKKALEKQIETHDAQLKDLQDKAKGHETLQAEITKLQEAQQQAKEQYEQQLQEERLSAAVKLSLAGKVQDVDIVAGLLDKAKIELDDKGAIKGGLDDQLTTLKESKSFLFVPEKETQQQQTNLRGFVPPAGDGGAGQPNAQPKSLGDAVAAFFSKGE
ncbi:phage scaffolding protein [Lysinibacillus sp. KU-BSD001]|uniref:phage scaffolding protein n=1 Tax=Lysinibacillus sp. KU-BSD001 TaxID=3141328 RepID=UPI0036E4F7F7